MRILFICNTLYQFLTVYCIKRTFFENESTDIVISDHTNHTEELYKKLQEGTLFQSAFYVKSRHLNDGKPKNVSIVENFDQGNPYDIVFCANWEPFTFAMYRYIMTRNPKGKLCWFEDGLSTYSFDFPQFLNPNSMYALADRVYLFNPQRLPREIGKETKWGCRM